MSVSVDLAADILKASKNEQVQGTAPRDTEIDEKQSLEIDRLTEEVNELKSVHGRTKIIHFVRLIGLALLFALVVAWLSFILYFIYLSGLRHPDTSLPVLAISDVVICALIGSTTVNVIGLFYIAAKWLYPHSDA